MCLAFLPNKIERGFDHFWCCFERKCRRGCGNRKASRQSVLLARGVELGGNCNVQINAGIHRDKVCADDNICQFLGKMLFRVAGSYKPDALTFQLLDDVAGLTDFTGKLSSAKCHRHTFAAGIPFLIAGDVGGAQFGHAHAASPN